MIRHTVTLMTTTGGFVPGESHRATCSTCGWRGDRCAERSRADAEARHHCAAARPVVLEPATQATADADGEAAERRHLSARMTSAGVHRAAAASLEAAVVARRMATLHRRRRAPLAALDRIIDVLELGHLAGRTCLDDRVCQELERLSGLVRLTEDVTGAADTRQLHAALLDLQEEVLDALIPSRSLYALQDDDDSARDARARSSRPLCPWRCRPWTHSSSTAPRSTSDPRVS
jgi:hypothetical protein